MKKLFALMMVSAFAVAIVACGGKKEEAVTEADTTAVAPAPAQDTTAQDTTAQDTTAAQ